MEHKKKKIGVITLYYRSFNCGGLLQAYALIQVLKGLGAEAEQISYDRIWDSREARYRRALAMPPGKILKKCLQKSGRRIKKRLLRKKNEGLETFFQQRVSAAEAFAAQIPHSKQVYNRETIGACGDKYDLFIAGSDQIWNPDLLQPAFLLDFVPKDKKKIAYGASISQFSLKRDAQAALKKGLSSFDGISVREKQAQNLLGGLTNQKIELVLDPTLLLPKEEWEKLCEKPAVKGPYMLCYFLGTDRRLRNLARETAKRLGLPIVTLPFLQNCYCSCDVNFGDIRLYNAGPEGFLSLIRYADCMLTDSFHGAVFAELFGARYLVFGRKGEKGMGSRLESLTQLFHSEQRYIPKLGEMTAQEAVLRLDERSVGRSGDGLEKMRQQSIAYLKRYVE